jgi:hypothetical protein
MANKKGQDASQSQSKTPGSGLPRSQGASGGSTSTTRRARIMKDEEVLPGDKARAADERGKTDDEDALDSGSTLRSARGSASRATKGSGGNVSGTKGSKSKG